MKEGRLPIAYRLLALHGPLTSIGLAELMNISRGAASSVLTYLSDNGGCESIGRVQHPDFKYARLNMWQAISPWSPRRKQPGIQGDNVTDEDLRWMKAQRDLAAARKARIAAINAVRARV